MALQGGIKIISGGTLSTAPADIAAKASALYGITADGIRIIENQYIFSQFMGNMINIGSGRVNMEPWVLEDGYDGWMYSDCLDSKPAYEYIIEKLAEMDYLNGSVSGVRFQDAVLDGGTESEFIYTVNSAGNDGDNMAKCLKNAHVNIDLGIIATCDVIPCVETCSIFNDLVFNDFKLC